MQYFGSIRPFHRWGSAVVAALSGFVLVSRLFGVAPASAAALRVAHNMNGNGKPDLVSAGAGFGGSTLSILPGNGDGTFQPPLTYSLAHNIYALPVLDGDFNRDANLDVAVGTTSAIGVLLNRTR